MARVKPGTLDTLACQDPLRGQRFPHLTEETCMRAMQLVYPDGRVYAGEQALPHLFRLMRRYRWLAGFLRLPGIAFIAPHAYRWIAKHRHMLAIIVAKKEVP